MANSDFDTIASTTLRAYDRSLADNIFKSTPTLDLMRRIKANHTGGRSHVKPILYGKNNTFSWYTGYDTLPCKPQEGITAAEYIDAMASQSISLCSREELENRGTSQLINLLRAKVMQAEKSMICEMNEVLINGGAYQGNRGMSGDRQGGEGLIGIEGILNWKRYPKLGGIDASRPDCAFWRSYMDDGGYWDAKEAGEEVPLVPFKLADLEDAYDCLTDGGDHPNVILMSKDLYQSYRRMLQPQYMQPTRAVANIGFDSLEFFGATVMWDHDVPADTIYLLNTDYLEFSCESSREFSTSDFRVPQNQDSKCAFIFFKGHLCTNNRSKHGMLCNRKPC